MTDLVEFLRARLDDDERRAPNVHALDCELTMTAGFSGPCTCGVPDRIAAEVDAKRRILDLHKPYQQGYMYTAAGVRVPNIRCSVCHDVPEDVDYDNPPYAVEFPCPTLRLLALPFAAHPDYRQEWRP